MRDPSHLGAYVRHGAAAGIRYERRYDRPAETVWKALTEPARLADWMGAARVEPYVGGRYELFIDSAQPMRGRVVTWQPPQLLEYSWHAADAPPSLVRCELVREGDGTRLIFRHRALRFAASCLSLGVFRMSDFKQPKNPRRQIANVGLVLLIHAALGYAVVTGLGHSVIRALDTETELRVIRDIKPVDMPPPLLAPPKLLPPPPASFVVPPIEIATPPQSPSRPLAAEPESIAPVSRKPEEIQPRPPLRVAPVIDAARACQMPQYPAVSIRQAEQGVVDLEFLIDVDGRVADSRIAASSGHDRLDQAARGALALCKFAPGTVDGKPERSWAHIRYRWTLAQ